VHQVDPTPLASKLSMKLVTVLTPCYNEEENVEPLYNAVKAVFAMLPNYRYEHLFIDNASTDATVSILRRLAGQDDAVKVIVNSRNFGPVRSPFHGILQARGDAVIGMVADFQDPPELIPELVAKWEQGFRVVMTVKEASKENRFMYALRERYYALLARISNVRIVQNATGSGLYDRSVIEAMRLIDDPFPFFRGLIAEIGFDVAEVRYTQPRRLRGVSAHNFYSLYDMAFLGIVSHSKVPLRLATMSGFVMASLSFVVAFGYLLAKLVFWNRFELGIAPVLIGFFFLSSVQLFFVGIVGEYIGSIFTRVQKLPLVFERERINF
jgi:glycosyltransferase involved in cell wall biosynthesis